MHKVLIVIISLLLFSMSKAQDLKPCGTPTYKSEWLKNYQKNPMSFEKRGNETLYVPLAVSLVGSNSGTGVMTETALMKSLCTLNSDFADSDIQFYLGTEVRIISDAEFFMHDDVLIGAGKMFEYNIPDMVNCYIVGNAGGFCGYNLPYAGVVISQNCAKPTDHTWAHEVGHNLSIQHPFLGWEGGVTHDNSVSHNFANPAPETVTYDYTYFKDTLILDTLIIDTIQVEKVDGSNCNVAADGFCDTSPDYLSFRWNCDNNNLSLGQQTDPNGEKFYSDGTLIMSYAMDECSSRFTSEQSGAMRANLIDEKASYLVNQNFEEIIHTSTNYLFPVNGEPAYFDKIDLAWEAIEGADFYLVRIAFDMDLNISLFDRIVHGTSIEAEVSSAFSQNKLFWSVSPLNNWNFCPNFIDHATFNTSNVSAVNDISQAQMFEMFPKVVDKSGLISFEVSDKLLGGKFVIQNIAGQIFETSTVEFSGQQSMEAPDQAGLYLASYILNGAVHSQKFIVR